jgi:hypothetical protein
VLLVDTNVFFDAADGDSPFHAAAAAFVKRQRNRPDAWFATWPIFYEFLRIATHVRVMRKPWSAPRAWDFVSAILKSPGFSVLTATERHADVAAEVLAELPHLSGNVFHDAHTAILMREHGIRRICSRDTDFHRFAFLEVVDPLAA